MDNEDGVWPASDEGLFDDDESIFGDEGQVDHDNPNISRADDVRMHSHPAQVAGGALEAVSLVAVFDEQGQPVVARHRMHKGKPLQMEEFRRPTADEYNSVMFGGKIVRGGVVAENTPTTTHLPGTMQRTPLGQVHAEKRGPDWKKIGLITVGGATVVAGGYYAYNRWVKK
jgi:hypothetical protein